MSLTLDRRLLSADNNLYVWGHSHRHQPVLSADNKACLRHVRPGSHIINSRALFGIRLGGQNT